MSDHPCRIVILGGGFGGVYTAKALGRLLRGRSDVEVSLVARENYFTFHPMLPEVISGEIGLLDTVSPLHRMLPGTRLYIREIENVDLDGRRVFLRPEFTPRPLELPFDHLVLALGNVTDFRTLPGLFEHALPFKTLADAVFLRNHLIRVLNEAAIESDPDIQRELMTFVVAGGGFSGVEVCAELFDFVSKLAQERRLTKICPPRVVLLHSGSRILERELPASLGEYAQSLLQRRGVEVRLKSRLATATPAAAVLAGGERIGCRTLVSTVPSSPHPLLAALSIPQDRGRIKTDGQLRVAGSEHLWAVGDCALIPLPNGEFAPPTAQHAVREAEVLATNLLATLNRKPLTSFAFTGLGKLGSLGRRSAVAELPFGIRLSGILAWFAWRTIYWTKLPGWDRKLRVGLSWLLDLLIPPETVQLRLGDDGRFTQLHFEPGETVFRQGDLGDAFYMILDGEVEVWREESASPAVPLARLGIGEYFGEMALVQNRRRTATIKVTQPTTVLAIRRGDFQTLLTHLPDLRNSVEGVMTKRGIPTDGEPVADETTV